MNNGNYSWQKTTTNQLTNQQTIHNKTKINLKNPSQNASIRMHFFLYNMWLIRSFWLIEYRLTYLFFSFTLYLSHISPSYSIVNWIWWWLVCFWLLSNIFALQQTKKQKHQKSISIYPKLCTLNTSIINILIFNNLSKFKNNNNNTN